MTKTSVIFAFRHRRRTSDLAENVVKVCRAGCEVGADGAELGAVDDELGPEVDERFGISGGAYGAAPGFAVLFAGGGDLLLHVHHDGIIDGGRAAEAQGHVTGAQEENVHARDGGDGFGVFESLRGFDLDGEEGLAVRLIGVVGGFADPVVGIATTTAEATVAEGREFDRADENAGLIGGADVRDHQTGRAVFEEAVEAVFFLRGRTPHAVDVGGVMTTEHGFDFASLPGAVFTIEPDAIVMKMRRDGRKKGDGRAGAADAGDFASAEFGEDFGASHGVGVGWS